MESIILAKKKNVLGMSKASYCYVMMPSEEILGSFGDWICWVFPSLSNMFVEHFIFSL